MENIVPVMLQLKMKVVIKNLCVFKFNNIIFIDDFINILPDHQVIFNDGNNFVDVVFQVVVRKFG